MVPLLTPRSGWCARIEREDDRMAQTGRPNLLMARILAASLAMGAVVFWIVGMVVTGGGGEGISPAIAPTGLALAILLVAFAVGTAGALVFRGRAAGIGENADRLDRAMTAQEMAAVQSNLVVSWALIEAPALFSGVFFLLLGEIVILGLAVPIYAAGVALTFPRAEWFGAGARAGDEFMHPRRN
jgi:hypothetical protein